MNLYPLRFADIRFNVSLDTLFLPYEFGDHILDFLDSLTDNEVSKIIQESHRSNSYSIVFQ